MSVSNIVYSFASVFIPAFAYTDFMIFIYSSCFVVFFFRLFVFLISPGD